MDRVRVSESTETALTHAHGIVAVEVQGKDELIFSENFGFTAQALLKRWGVDGSEGPIFSSNFLAIS